MPQIIPVFRVFDYQKAIDFYVNYLEFAVTSAHKPEDGPFYLQVSFRDVSLDLSEHHSECSPGAKIIISDVQGLKEYHQLLTSKAFKYMNPALGRFDWDKETLTMTVIDPFSNKIVFTEKQ